MKDHDDPPVTPADAVRGLGAMSSQLVHAMRNPVAAFATSFDLLSGGRVDADDVAQLHRVIRNEIQKLNEMLLRCGELSRLATLTLVRIDLTALVVARLDAARDEFAAREIRVESELAEAVMIMGDESHLDAAIDALLSNAYEAMPKGGVLSVSLVRGGSEGAVTLAIRDTGVGIAPTVLPNVFRLFYTTRKGAAGMGLPMARQVFTAHGARLELASVEGAGSTATARFGAQR